jgi:excisionase family DNA binding protein
MSDLSPKQVAAALGLSRSAVYRLIEDGELRAYRVRGRLRVEPAEVRALRERNRVNPRRRPGRPMYEPLPLSAAAADGRFAAELKTMRGTT